MSQRLNKLLCSYSNSCSFDNVYQPLPISSSLKFIGISAFYSTFVTLAPSIPLVSDTGGNFDLSSMNFTQLFATIQTICSQPWSNLSNPDTKYRPCRIDMLIIILSFYLYSFMFLFNVSLDIG
jgi:hypothetical protein